MLTKQSSEFYKFLGNKLFAKKVIQLKHQVKASCLTSLRCDFCDKKLDNKYNLKNSANFVKLTSFQSLHLRHLSSQPKQSASSLPERIVSSFPKNAQIYLRLIRLDKPTGIWLLLWPCYWSISLATPAGQLPSLSTILLFGVGATVMRGAGCIINDFWDRDFDAKIERTKSRPLASRQISSKEALAFECGLLGIGLSVILHFDLFSILLGSSSLLLVVVYPLMKRITYWPQIVLGMTFNWGALLGWSVVSNGSLDLTAVLPIYFAGVCWTMIYDTIYAHQDIKDDLSVGVKSTAIKFGEKTSQWLTGFSIAMIANLLCCGLTTQQCWPYYACVGLTAMNLTQQLYTLNIHDPNDCSKKFKKNVQIGWVLFLGIVISTLFKS